MPQDCNIQIMNEKHSNMTRLFFVAGYNKDGIIDDALIYYISTLSKMGDVVLCMDCNCTHRELSKVKKFCKYVSGKRHGEYDFGSYKRAYAWAKENLNMTKYNFTYMVNDSVYGPLFDIEQYLIKMEGFNTDAFGIIENPKKSHPHIQSWFIGMRQSVFLSQWFDDFIQSVTHHDNKGVITHLYEHGFSTNVISHGGTWKCIYVVKGRGVYNNVKKLYRAKIPFIKKISFTRHDGGLGRQIKYVLAHIPKKLNNAIIKSASSAYGKEYIKTILSRNMLSTMYHNIKYGIRKTLTGKL